jgi:nitroreductase
MKEAFSMELEQALKERRTVRRFLQTPIPESELRELIDAARAASCARNDQRLRYIVVRTPEVVNTLFTFTAWAGAVTPRRNPVPGVTSPVAFIAVAGPAAEADTPLLQTDCGAAIQTIQLAAWGKGIGCCWMGAINRKEIHALLGMSSDEALLYVVALGYAAEKPVSEDIDDPRKVKYYLDDEDLLHVPKLTVDAITSWK